MALAELSLDFIPPAENAETVVCGIIPRGLAFVEMTAPSIRIFPGGNGTMLRVYSWRQHIDNGAGYLGSITNPSTQIRVDRISGKEECISYPVHTDVLVVVKSPALNTASGLISWDEKHVPHSLANFIPGALRPRQDKIIDY